jgi:hypothetical protein
VLTQTHLNFINLLNQAVPAMEQQQSSIMMSLNRAITRGHKLSTGRGKENLDMMSTKQFT